MEPRTHIAFTDRFRVLAAVLISFAAGYGPIIFFGGEGLWWARILLIGSAPLIATAAIIALIFARSVAKHPYRWASAAALSAVGLSVVWMWLATGSIVGVTAAAIAFPAAGVFMCLARLWPGLTQPKKLRGSVMRSAVSET